MVSAVLLCRGFDPVAPVIHEWTYEAMAYDLLNLDGEVFRYDVETQAGEHQAVGLTVTDVQLRNLHRAHATCHSQEFLLKDLFYKCCTTQFYTKTQISEHMHTDHAKCHTT